MICSRIEPITYLQFIMGFKNKVELTNLKKLQKQLTNQKYIILQWKYFRLWNLRNLKKEKQRSSIHNL
jgi:hypothetical protein